MSDDDHFNPYELAYRAWDVLIKRAKEGHPITYGELANALGIHHRPVKYVLSKIQDYCLHDKLPPLTILVEDQKGNVGKGFIAWDTDDLASGREKVYAENWTNRANPFAFASSGATPDEVANAIATGTTTPSDAFAKVRVRGTAQVVFRKTMLRVYDGQCAFSGDKAEPLLQAAHIIPWGVATPGQRLDPTNGILLNVLHHRMFDLDWLRIDEDYRIRVNRNALTDHTLSAEQDTALNKLDGSRIKLPRDERHWPSKEFLARRREDPKLLREVRAELRDM
jgi:putative restriction endonuclease